MGFVDISRSETVANGSGGKRKGPWPRANTVTKDGDGDGVAGAVVRGAGKRNWSGFRDVTVAR